jgi:hypothetical protein
VRGPIGQTGPMAVSFDTDAAPDCAVVDCAVVDCAVVDCAVVDCAVVDCAVVDCAVADSVGVVAVALPVGDEDPGADCGLAVVVELPGVRGDWLVLCVQAVTPRPKTAGTRTISVRRLRGLFMIVPNRCIREVQNGPSRYHPLPVQCSAEATQGAVLAHLAVCAGQRSWTRRPRLDLPVVRARLALRHEGEGAALQWSLERSRELDAILETAGLEDFTVDASDLSITDRCRAGPRDGLGRSPPDSVARSR